MAKQIVYFSGRCQWAKVHKPDDGRFGEPKFSIDVLLDMDQFTKFKSFKVKNNGKPEDGKMWVTFRRIATSGPPFVVDNDGNKMEDTIGNGSEVTCKLEIEQFVSKKYGAITKSTLLGVQVNKLVKYVKPEEQSNSTVTPAVGTETASPAKPRIMF